MSKRYGLADVCRMVAEVKAQTAAGKTVDEAAKTAGFTDAAQYYYQARRMDALTGWLRQEADKGSAEARELLTRMS